MKLFISSYSVRRWLVLKITGCNDARQVSPRVGEVRLRLSLPTRTEYATCVTATRWLEYCRKYFPLSANILLEYRRVYRRLSGTPRRSLRRHRPHDYFKVTRS